MISITIVKQQKSTSRPGGRLTVGTGMDICSSTLACAAVSFTGVPDGMFSRIFC